MKRITLATLLLCSLVAGLPVAAAVSPAITSPAPLPESGGQHTRTLPLSKFITQAGPIRFKRAKDQFSLSIPRSVRTSWKAATLHLAVTNSLALIKSRSQMAIAVNEHTVTQLPLDGQHPETATDVPLPLDRLHAGFNTLNLNVVQHYQIGDCEDFDAPELWTEIDPVRSTITVVESPEPIKPRLADLQQLISPKEWGQRPFVVMPAPGRAVDAPTVQIGSMLAQAVALRLKYVPAVIDFHPATASDAPAATGLFPKLDQTPLRQADGILFGTRAQLAPVLAADVAARITGPFLGVYPADADPTRLLVVVSGTTDAEVATAANTFAFLDFPFPTAAEALVSDVAYPAWPDYAGFETLLTDGHYAFSQLGLSTRTINAHTGEVLEMNFSVPPDLAGLDRDKAVLHMHMSHGAGLRNDSVINVMLNGHMEAAIQLTQAGGAVYDDYRVEIPVKVLQPGHNTLSFAPHFMLASAGNCAPMAYDNLLLTIFGDSVITLPEVPHYVTMPDLHLLARAGFPYTVKPDGRDTQLVLTAVDRGTIASAWMLAGRLAQMTGAPLYQMKTVLTGIADARNLLVVGPSAGIPAAIGRAAPVGLTAPITFPNPAVRPVSMGRAWDLAVLSRSTRPEAARIGQQAGLGELVVAEQFQNPGVPHGTVTLFAAATSERLYTAVQAIIQPEVWSDLSGNVAVWDGRTQHLTCQATGATYAWGSLGMTGWIGLAASRRPIMYAAVVMGVLALLSMLIALWLRRRKEQGDAIPGRSH